VNVEKTIEFILDQQAKAEVRAAKAEAQMAAIRTIVKAGMKLLAAMQQEHRRFDEKMTQLAAAQRESEEEIKQLAAAQRESKEEIKQLAAAQRESEEKIKQVAAAQLVTEKKLQALLESWRRRGTNGRGR
jgi:hypothetical protein